MLFEHANPLEIRFLEGELAEHGLHVYFSKSEITKFTELAGKQ